MAAALLLLLRVVVVVMVVPHRHAGAAGSIPPRRRGGGGCAQKGVGHGSAVDRNHRHAACEAGLLLAPTAAVLIGGDGGGEAKG